MRRMPAMIPLQALFECSHSKRETIAMRRRGMIWLSVVAVLLASTIAAEAASPRKPKEPRRYYRGSFAEYLLVPQPWGKPSVRTEYSGYSSNFRPPAMYYYGYPFAERSYGAGM